MTTNEPSQAATEEAVARLLWLAFIEIRYATSPLTEDQSFEALIKRRDRINELADLCHHLPNLLAPELRHRLIEGVRYTWRVSSDRKRQWMRSRWDHIGYDYSWLDDNGAAAHTTGGQSVPPWPRVLRD